MISQKLCKLIENVCCLFKEYLFDEVFIIKVNLNTDIFFLRYKYLNETQTHEYKRIEATDKYFLTINFRKENRRDINCKFGINFSQQSNLTDFIIYNNLNREDSSLINTFCYQKLKRVLSSEENKQEFYNVTNYESEYLLLKKYGRFDDTYHIAPIPLYDLYQNSFSKIDDTKVIIKNEEFEITKTQFEMVTDYYANRLATCPLLSKDMTVGIHFKDEGLATLAIFSAIKAGFCFVLINPLNPKPRVDYIIQDSKIKVILSDNPSVIKNQDIVTINFDLKFPTSNGMHMIFKNETNMEKPCYIIYTSGSTGKPKGVIISQKSLSIIINWFTNYFPFNSSVRSMHILNYTFDFGLFDIISTVLCGGLLFYFKKKKAFKEICYAINNEKLNNICTTPSLFNILSNCSIEMPTLKILHFGGEQLMYSDVNQFRQLLSQDCRIFNGYGPSECTIGNTIYEVVENYPHSENIPIGFPNGNNGIIILNKSNNISPLGGIGEICITGDGLGLGFTGDTGTLHSYITIKNHKKKIYRSGDLGYWNYDGSLQFVARINQEIKINGYRIDFSEIEQVITCFPEINDCVCLGVNKTESIKILVAFLTCNHSYKVDIDTLRMFISEHLPQYMIPHKFVILERFPLNSSGKVDLKKLKDIASIKDI